jgi:prepilin-type N-terminal cleavage/methylation domain-containing protein
MLVLAERKKRLGGPVRQGRNHNGLTLIEMMVVVVVTLIFMLALTQVFSILGDSVNSGRSMIELNGNIRSISKRIQRDLNGVTVPLDPPIDLSRGAGYFEYVEGPASDKDSDADGNHDYLQTVQNDRPYDTRLGDRDDVLMFTVRSEGAPFVGRITGYYLERYRDPDLTQDPDLPVNDQSVRYRLVSDPGRVHSIESQVAEIIYWMYPVDLNGDDFHQPNEWNLYRRVLLIRPDIVDLSAAKCSIELVPTFVPTFREYNDLSVRWEAASSESPVVPTANSLADLTKRENRFARLPTFPYSIDRTQLTPFGIFPDPDSRHRQGEDLLLDGVLAFDVRAFDHLAAILSVNGQALIPGDPGWDPNVGQVIATGAYVDLNYYTDGLSTFSGPAHPKSGLVPTPIAKSTYDTWSFHYEHDGLDTDNDVPTLIDEGVDGIDNDGSYGADDLMERETSPPYPVPLRGIQVQVRLYEPSSQAVKQATITANFVE